MRTLRLMLVASIISTLAIVGGGTALAWHPAWSECTVEGTKATADWAGWAGTIKQGNDVIGSLEDAGDKVTLPKVGVEYTYWASNGEQPGNEDRFTPVRDCDPPVVRHHRTSVRWYGPCGDPMHGVVLGNSGDYTETFTFKFDKYHVGRVAKVYVLAPHTTRWTGWKHVTGNTLMKVRNRGNLWTRWSAAPGNYKTCVAPGQFTVVR